MRVCFAGYGSIAKRHINNLSSICKKRDISLEIDLLRFTSSDVPQGIHEVFSDVDQIDTFYDAVFITNPTSRHYVTLLELFDTSNTFFIEKPVFDQVGLDLSPFENPAKRCYVACPLRYTNVLQWVKNNVEFSKVRSVRAISSSYLPDWRPGVDYRQTYSAHASMGGGVSIDLIHEWDYLVYLMGFPQTVKAVIGKFSELEIDSDDIALYIADYGNKIVELHLDYFGRASIRRLEVLSDDETYVCDLLAGNVEMLKSSRLIDLTESRDDFQVKELEHFLDIVDGLCESDNGIPEAVKTLEIARGVYS